VHVRLPGLTDRPVAGVYEDKRFRHDD